MRRHRWPRPCSAGSLLALLALLGLVTGCGGPPKKALDDARSAFAEARIAEECAPEQYVAARKMLDRAQRLSDEGEYTRAKEVAKVAQQLADTATLKAQENLSRCRKKQQKNAPSAPSDTTASVAQPSDPSDDEASSLQTVFFGYDSSTLNPAAMDVLKGNAAWMRRNAGSKLTIAGHCDERGSTEYNLALGEQRALTVKKYLTTLGIEGARIAVISYGEELPLVDSVDPRSLARNRRAEFKPQ